MSPTRDSSVRYVAYTLSLPECAVTDLAQVHPRHLGDGLATFGLRAAIWRRLAVDQQIPADLCLLRIQFDDRALEHAVAVDAAWVDGKRPAHLLDAAALVDVAVYGQQRLMLVDG